jgi:hypothetical protein
MQQGLAWVLITQIFINGGNMFKKLLKFFKPESIITPVYDVAAPSLDVPRENGWPTIPPEEFTSAQLAAEAYKWAHKRGTGYVGAAEFDKYNDELKRRGIEFDWSEVEVDWY